MTIKWAQQIVAAMTGNSNFTTPHPTLAQVTTAINDLETAYAATQAARQDAKNKTIAQRGKEETLDGVLTQLASYVESVSGGNAMIITSAGMDMRSTETAPGDVDTPEAFTATASDRDGEIDLHWDKVANARSYVIEQSPDPPTATSWTHAAVATKSHVTIEGLTSGTKYWFRVAAVGPRGQSPWSNPATKMAP